MPDNSEYQGLSIKYRYHLYYYEHAKQHALQLIIAAVQGEREATLRYGNEGEPR